MRPRPSLLALSAALALSTVACGDGGSNPPPPAPDAGLGVHARFELREDPMDFGAIPWPDDLYLREGRVALGAFPHEAEATIPTLIDSMRASLSDLDGFGVNSPVFFGFDGDLDPASLPATPGDSLAEDASAFLVDADPASPDAFRRVPVVVRWDAADGLLSLQPMAGHPLASGRRYAAVVTTSVRGRDGVAVAPAPAFAALRDATERPSDALSAEAYDGYAPVLASLATNGVPRERVAALAVFHVQTIERDLADARALVRSGDAPAITLERVVGGADLDALLGTPAEDLPGRDVEGGVRHSHIGWVVDGTFPTFELASPRPGVHGQWTRDASGALVVRRQDTAWFTLVLPNAADLSRVPVIIFQHGLGDQRSSVFAVADTLCAAGFAVATIDAPYHGMRLPAGIEDTRHAFGGTPGPDLYGDLGGQGVYADFLGIADTDGALAAFHPFYTRDVFRQAVVDLMTLVRVLDDGDFSGVASMGGPTFALSDAPMGFVGISLGGILGTTFAATEDRVEASFLSVTGGHLARLVEESASFGEFFLGILLPRAGLDYDAIDWRAHPASSLPGVAVFQTLLDRGDSMSYARLLGGRPVHVLFHEAENDETVPNSATEGLARAVGLPIAGATPQYTDLELGSLPLSANVTIGAARVTRGLTVWSPATHVLLLTRRDEQVWAHPPLPPFESAPPTSVDNPIDGVQAQMLRFFTTWQGGTPEIAAP